jgi:hypothetical protein
LKGPNEEIAKDILIRIAAKVVPIMKNQGMDVMSLEEFEPNREFVGRYDMKNYKKPKITLEIGMLGKPLNWY